MKFFYGIIKKICLGFFCIYSVNVLFSLIGIVLPFNFFTVGLSSIFGLYGIFVIIFLKLML